MKEKNYLGKLMIIMIFTTLFFIIISCASAKAATISELKNKFPNGAYWNHVGGTNNPDGYTWKPCTCASPHNLYGNCDCNSFGNSIQCYGYANKVTYDYYGSMAQNWPMVYNLNSLKAGDVIRYKNNGHSIWVTKVDGDTITYTDCNSDGHCKIRWGATMNKSDIWGLTNVWVAPYAAVENTGSNPQGVVDVVTGGTNSIFVRGWAFDADDISASLAIHVYIGGPAGTGEGHAIMANTERTDVNNVYGCGNYHGYSTTISTELTGSQVVYVYAINIGSGNNTLLGTSTVDIKNLDYKACIDAPTDSTTCYNSDLNIKGWSISKTNITAVQYSLNGGVWTNLERFERTDVSKVYPGYPEGEEGFKGTIDKYKLNKGSNTIAFRTLYDGDLIRDMGSRTFEANYDYIPEDIFEYNGNIYGMYYAPVSWTTASELCKKAGGHLLTINNNEENAEIIKHLNGNRYWIGLNDATTEGEYVWEDGSTSSYRNYASGEPNNANDNEDYFEILQDGTWNDLRVDGAGNNIGFILEIEKTSINLSNTKIDNGKMYEVYENIMPWTIAQWYAESKGGNLVTISSAEENSFIRSLSSKQIWIGLNDSKKEGEFEWINNNSTNYTNWAADEPNNTYGTQNYARMYADGTWDDVENYVGYSFVIEYPSAINGKIESPEESTVFEGNDTITISGFACSNDEIQKVMVKVNDSMYDVYRFDRADIREQYPDAIDGNEGFEVTLPKTSFKYGSNTANIIIIDEDGKYNEFGKINFTVYKEYEPVKVGYYNGKIYAVYDDVNSWSEAREFCETRGGNLAAITSRAEQNYITSLLDNSNVGEYWIGASRDTDGNFNWVTDENFAYTNWNSGEPNNSGGTENCIVIGSDGKWSDENDFNSSPVGFIYEFNTNDLEVSKYSAYDGSEYYLYNKAVPYAIAEKYAEIIGGHILNITSKEENDFVKNMMYSTNGVIYRVWLSLIDENKDGNFKWTNGEPFNYNEWYSDTNEPNNSYGIEHYATIVTYGWNDVKADYVYLDLGFIVEFSTDINQSGKNDYIDAAMLLKHISDIKPLTYDQYSVADINGDGKVDMIDVIDILGDV